jgi:2-dehydro-3-deoxyphosphogluconate aldolase/(4S)-4-hydroxy-2-oxoglutarate aldolase
LTAAEEFFHHHLNGSRAMVILRGHSPDETVRLCGRAYDLGITLVEVPVQDAPGMAALEAAVAWGRARDGVAVGSGTITTAGLLREVVARGAAFTVAPGLDDDVAAESSRLDVPHLPGVATGTEITHALKFGFTWLKAFPAGVLGTAWFRAMKGPFPQVRFVATGGVDAVNAPEFLGAGAAGVSFGSSFATAPPDAVRGIAVRP